MDGSAPKLIKLPKMHQHEQKIKKIEAEGISGGGTIKVSLNGDGELIKLTIYLI